MLLIWDMELIRLLQGSQHSEQVKDAIQYDRF